MLRISEISFPGLGIDSFTVDSEAFSIFGVSIAWYAVIITFGMICAVVYAATQSKKIGVTLDDICDFALWTIPIGIVGARLYFVLTSLEDFSSFEEIINIRNGGLAIYGGIIAGAATVFVVSKVKKIDFLALADCVAPGVLLAQGIGRWGNFMNGEAFGAQTDSFLRMGIDNIVSLYTFGTTDMVYVHPTFLYESLWNLLGVLLVYLYSRYLKKKYDGELFIMIFGWYGLGRMFIEGLRMDSLYSEIFGLRFRTSQVLAAVIFVICLSLYIYFLVKRPTRPFYYKETTAGDIQESDNKKCAEAKEDKANFSQSGSEVSDEFEPLCNDDEPVDESVSSEAEDENRAGSESHDESEEIDDEVNEAETPEGEEALSDPQENTIDEGSENEQAMEESEENISSEKDELIDDAQDTGPNAVAEDERAVDDEGQELTSDIPEETK